MPKRTAKNIAPDAKGSYTNMLSRGISIPEAWAELNDNALAALIERLRVDHNEVNPQKINHHIKKVILPDIGEQPMLIVADNGCGMDDEKLFSIQTPNKASDASAEIAGKFGAGYAQSRETLSKNSGTTLILSHCSDTLEGTLEDNKYKMDFAAMTMVMDMDKEDFQNVEVTTKLTKGHIKLWEEYAIDDMKTGSIFFIPLDEENYTEINEKLYSTNVRENIAVRLAERYTDFIKKGVIISLILGDEIRILPSIPTASEFVIDPRFKKTIAIKTLKTPVWIWTAAKKNKAPVRAIIDDETDNKTWAIMDDDNLWGVRGKKKIISRGGKKPNYDKWVTGNIEDEDALKLQSTYVSNIEGFIDFQREVLVQLGVKVPRTPLKKSVDKNGELKFEPLPPHFPREWLFRSVMKRNGLSVELGRAKCPTHQKHILQTVHTYNFTATESRDALFDTQVNKMRTERSKIARHIQAAMYNAERNTAEKTFQAYIAADKADLTANNNSESDSEDDSKPKLKVLITKKKPVNVKLKTNLVVSAETINLDSGSNDGEGSGEESNSDADAVSISSDLRHVDQYVADNGLKAAEVVSALEEIAVWLQGSSLIGEALVTLTRVHKDLMDKFVISKGKELFFHQWLKEIAILGISKLIESITRLIKEFYKNDRGVLRGADIKVLYKELKDEQENQLEEECY